MYFIVFLQGFVFYGPISTLYRQSRGLSMYQIFLIESMFWLLMIVFEIPWGYFADRFGYKRTLIFSNILFFVSKIVFYKAHSFNMFLLERIILAMVFSGISGCDAAILYSSVEEGESQRVFGKYQAFGTGGLLIASLASSYLIEGSLDNAVRWTIFPYFMAMLATFFLHDPGQKAKQKADFKKSVKHVLENRNFIMLLIAVALIQEVYQSVSVFLNQLQYIRCGVDVRYFGMILVLMQLARTSSAKSHLLSEKIGFFKSMKFLYGVIITSSISLVFAENGVVSVMLVLAIGMSMSLMAPMVMEIENRSIGVGERATILSIYAMVKDIVGAFSNIAIGKAADFSLQAAFLSCFATGLLGLLMLFFYFKRNSIKNLK